MPKCTKKIVTFGRGSGMEFGMMSWEGTTDLRRLNFKVNGTVYKNFLRDYVIPALQNSKREKHIFMQDNALCHKANHVVVVEFFKEQNLHVFD